MASGRTKTEASTHGFLGTLGAPSTCGVLRSTEQDTRALACTSASPLVEEGSTAVAGVGPLGWGAWGPGQEAVKQTWEVGRFSKANRLRPGGRAQYCLGSSPHAG